MWLFLLLMKSVVIPVKGQDVLPAAVAPASIVVNLTLESEDGYVDSRQITVTLSPSPDQLITTSESNGHHLQDTFWSWTAFSNWSPCSVTCGPGLQVGERFCVLVSGGKVVDASPVVDPCLDQEILDHENDANVITTSAPSSPRGQPSEKRYRKCETHLCPSHQFAPTDDDSPNYPSPTQNASVELVPGHFDSSAATDNNNILSVPEVPVPSEPEEARRELCSKYDDTEYADDKKYKWVPFHSVYAPCALLCRPIGETFYVSFADRVPDGLPCNFGDPRGSSSSSGSSSRGVCLNGTCQAVGCTGVLGAEPRHDLCGVCDGDSSTCQRIKIEFFEQNLPVGHNKIGSIPIGACNISLVEQKPTGNVFALRTVRGYFLNGQWTASPTGDYPSAGTVFRYEHIINGNSLRRHGEKVTAPGPTTEDVDVVLITKRPNDGITLEYIISTHRSQASWDSPSRRHRADSYYYDNDHESNHIHRGDIPSIAEDFVDTPIVVESPTTDFPELSNEIPATPAPRQDRHVWTVAGYTPCSKTCGKGIRQSNIVCMLENARRIVDDVYCENIIRPAVFQEPCHQASCAAEWEYGEWSECSVSCGTGTQSREARCKQQQGDGVLADVSDDVCGGIPTQGITRACQNQACRSFFWRSGEWSSCDTICGTGSQRRLVKCFDELHSAEVGEENCGISSKPAETQSCDGGVCRGMWLMSDWDLQCSNKCGDGQTTRHIVCFKDNRQQDAQMCDANSRPQTHQTCSSQKECGGRWFEGPWSDCSPACGSGSQNRDVVCISPLSYDRSVLPTCEILPESECKYHPKPENQRQCQSSLCHDGAWYTSPWSECSHSCGVGVRSRQVMCLNKYKELSNDCPQDLKPGALESCGTDICQLDTSSRQAQGSANPTFIAQPSIDLNNKAGTYYDAQPSQDDRRYARPPVDLNNKAGTLYDAQPSQDDRRYARPPVDLNNKAGTLYDAQPSQDDRRYARPPVDLNNKAGTLYDAQPSQDDRRYARPPVDLNNKAGTLYDAQPSADDRRYARPPVDLNNKAGTLYDAQPAQDDRRYARPPVDLNNKAGTLYDAPLQDDRRRPSVDLNNKAGTLYDAQPLQDDRRRPVDLSNKAGTLYDAPLQDDRRRPPVDLNNKAGTLYDAPLQDDRRRPPVDLNNKAGTLYDAQPLQDDRRRAPIDLNNKAGTLYDAPLQDDRRRPPVDLNNKAGTLYDAQPQQDDRRYAQPPVDLNNKAGTLYADDRRRPPVDLNNKAGTLYDAQPQQDDRRYARPPVDLNNKAGTLYDAPLQDDRRRPPVDLNNKAGTLYDSQPLQDDRRRPPVDLNNKAGTLYDAQPLQDDRRRPPVDLNNKAGSLYDSQPLQDDRRPPVDLNNKAGTLYDPPRQAPPPPVASRKGDPGIRRTQASIPTTPQPVAYQSGPDPGRGDTPFAPPSAARSSQSRRESGSARNRTRLASVDIDLSHLSPGSRNGQSDSRRRTRPAQVHSASSGSPTRHTAGGRLGKYQKPCADRIDRCSTVKELAFCRYDYYKKMCCKSCS